MLIHVDGSVLPQNPGGVVGYGWHADTGDSGFGIAFEGGDSATNNIGEYTSVAAALIWVLSQRISSITVTIKSDSELLVNQLNGLWRVKHANLKPIAAIVHMMIETLNGREIEVVAEWIPREENKVADDLSRRALKQQLKERYPMTKREKREGQE